MSCRFFFWPTGQPEGRPTPGRGGAAPSPRQGSTWPPGTPPQAYHYRSGAGGGRAADIFGVGRQMVVRTAGRTFSSGGAGPAWWGRWESCTSPPAAPPPPEWPPAAPPRPLRVASSSLTGILRGRAATPPPGSEAAEREWGTGRAGRPPPPSPPPGRCPSVGREGLCPRVKRTRGHQIVCRTQDLDAFVLLLKASPQVFLPFPPAFPGVAVARGLRHARALEHLAQLFCFVCLRQTDRRF